MCFLLLRRCVVHLQSSWHTVAQGVAAAVRDVVQQHGGMDEEAAAAYVKRLETSLRYSVEAWS